MRSAGGTALAPQGPFRNRDVPMNVPGENRAGNMRLALLMAAVGATAVMAQSLYVREVLVAFFGNELTLGVVRGCWLAGVTTGAWVGGRWARRSDRPLRLLVGAASAGVLVLPGGIVAARALRLIAGAEPGGYLPFHWLLAGSALVTIPFGFVMGFIFPTVGRAARYREGVPASGISVVYVAEAAGAVAGGAAFSLLLVGRVSAFRIGAWMTSLVVGLAVLPGAWRALRVGRRFRACACLLPVAAALAAAVFAAGPLDRITTRLRWRATAPGQELVAATDSPYGNIALGRWAGQYNLYLDGHFAGSFPEPRIFSHAAHLVLCQHPRPRRVLVVGSGMEGLLAPMLLHGVSIDYVELDPVLPRFLWNHIREEDRRALGDERVVLLVTDGRAFIRALGRGGSALERHVEAAARPGLLAERRNGGGKPRSELLRERLDRIRKRLERTRRVGYDVVFVNVPEPANASLNRFYTLEFLREVKRVMAPRGVLAATLPTAGVNYLGIDAVNYTGSFYHTLREVFGQVVVAPDPSTRYFFASDSPGAITSDPALLAQRYRSRSIQDPNFHWIQFRGDFPPQRVRRLAADLESHTSVPRNTDQQPITYFFDTILWGRYSRSRISGAFHAFERLSFWFLIGLCGVVALGWALVNRRAAAGRRGTASPAPPAAPWAGAAVVSDLEELLRLMEGAGRGEILG